MTINKSKKSIMEHLSLTSNLNFEGSSQSSEVTTLSAKKSISMTPDSRKKTISEHLARSSGKFNTSA